LASGPLSDTEVERFRTDGFVVLRGFYDLADIVAVQRALHHIIGLVIARHGLDIAQAPFQPDRFDDGFEALCAADRRFGGEVYDAAKLVPAFIRLAASEQNEAVLRQLRGTQIPGFARGGLGIRIDPPREDKYLANWHQEYLYQLRSLDGLTLWSPLVPVDDAVGPVRFCRGSHRDGIRPMHRRLPEQPGPYGLAMCNDDSVVANYPQLAPHSQPGDAIIIDYLTIHRSTPNTGTRTRWSMQMRFFNFAEPTGLDHGWRRSIAEGEDPTAVHPEHHIPQEV
jgi:hypothetical protein